MPCRASENAREKMPALAPSLRIGVGARVQDSPRSRDRNTRAAPGPPVPNQAAPLRLRIKHVLLAANAPSLGSAGGVGRRFHVTPPSVVGRIANWPWTGSPSASA